MNVAYIISAYRLPGQLVRLVRRLDAPGTSFFIHVDAKSEDAVFRAMAEPLRDRPNVHFLPRHACYWGDFGHVQATLKGLSALLAAGQPFDYVVLLTGQDYPLRSNAEIAATLEAAAGQVMLHWMPIPNPHWTDGGAYRIEHWHFRLGRRPLSFPGAPFRHAWLNAAWSLPARLLRLRRSFPHGLSPYGGSSYWIMPADCARYVDGFVRSHPDFVRFFRHVRVPDEIFFHTIVMNSPFRGRVAADDLRYIDWGAGGDNPKVLTTADFDALMRSGKLFARKFDPHVDAVVLDRIDQALAEA
ncbi:MAG TPA: beta-1,6-N-acetylglucosaminyltransferase [Longimicrobiales bacterium]|nr:beta-1,6-N-acetylglucosaminyltransferase [Longimicrobiales bacterium]